MTVVWSARAIAHLEDLRAQVARHAPHAAGEIAATLLVAVESLVKNPDSGHPGRVAGTREHFVPGTPYVLPYRRRDDRLEVLAVFFADRSV